MILPQAECQQWHIGTRGHSDRLGVSTAPRKRPGDRPNVTYTICETCWRSEKEQREAEGWTFSFSDSPKKPVDLRPILFPDVE